jgi:hypothetical protein
MNNFDFLTSYNYYGRRPKNALNEDELDDALGLSDPNAESPTTPEDTTDDTIPAASGDTSMDAANIQTALNNELPADIAPVSSGSENAVQLDVTQLVQKQDEINKTVQDVLAKISDLIKGNETLKSDMESKMQTFQDRAEERSNSMSKELEMRIPTPIEKLQLQSLHSFPYNVKLTDYWQPTQEDKYKYAIGNAKEQPLESNEAPTKPDEYILKQSDIMKGYDENFIKRTLSNSNRF